MITSTPDAASTLASLVFRPILLCQEKTFAGSCTIVPTVGKEVESRLQRREASFPAFASSRLGIEARKYESNPPENYRGLFVPNGRFGGFLSPGWQQPASRRTPGSDHHNAFPGQRVSG